MSGLEAQRREKKTPHLKIRLLTLPEHGLSSTPANSYTTSLLHHLSESASQTPTNLVGVYISTHTAAFSLSGNGGVGGTGGFLTKGVVDLMLGVERSMGGRGRAVLVVHGEWPGDVCCRWRTWLETLVLMGVF